MVGAIFDFVNFIFPVLFFGVPIALAFIPGLKWKRALRCLLGFGAMTLILIALHRYEMGLHARKAHEMKLQYERDQHG